MKTKISFVSILVLMVPFLIKSQVTDSMKKFSYADDSILKRFVNTLPKSWTFTATDSTIIISRNDSVIIAKRKLIHFTSRKGPNLPVDSIKKYGHKGKTELIYRYEPRWTEEQKLRAISNNDEIIQQLANLPDKYGIANLLDKTKSTKLNNVYTGHTDKEIQMVRQFEIEKNYLLSKMETLPTNISDKYSFFFKSSTGVNDNINIVYPIEAYQQFFDILALFNELTEKSE
ncbi:MAG: hypothetical protein ABR968_01570 [Bacteroidales bacterium]